jgi:hypothetical protein
MTPRQFVKAYKRDGSIKAVARVNSITYHAARSAYLEAVEEGLMPVLRVGRKRSIVIFAPLHRTTPICMRACGRTCWPSRNTPARKSW